MSIYLEIVDLDQVFHSLKSSPVILNDWDISRKEDKEKLNEILYTHYEGDTLDIVPSCGCNTIKGEYNIGVRCNKCNTVVSSITERPLESLLWMVPPPGVKAFINPKVWSIFKEAFSVKNVNMVEYLTNPRYVPPMHLPVLEYLDAKYKRSLNYFHDNFDVVMEDLLLLLGNPLKKSSQLIADMRQFVFKFRDRIFCHFLPFPSRIGFITESTPLGTYVDVSMKEAIDAIRTITSINNTIKPLSHSNVEARTTKAISQLATYYRSYEKDTLGAKRGIFRKHIFGGRLHFTARAVITAIVGKHRYDELHIPWGLATQLLKIHMTNKLLRRGYTPNDISAMFYEYVNQYSPLFDEIFTELIVESPHKGIPVLLNRNPSLALGLFKVKTWSL